MILILFSAFVLHSCLHLLCSATYHDNISSMPICPKSFTCPAFDCPKSFTCPAFDEPFMYPFYESNASDTQCGLIKVNCSLHHENIQFEDQDSSYEIAGKHGPDIVIRNTTFLKLMQNESSCEALENNFASPTPLLFSILLTGPTLTLFKCTGDPSFAKEIDAYFIPSDYNSYNCGQDHKFYSNHLIRNPTIPSDLPPTCEVIRLPVKKPSPDCNEYCGETNIFSLLTHEFSISFKLTPFCEECRKKEGRCHADHKGQLECRKKEGRCHAEECLMPNKVAEENHGGRGKLSVPVWILAMLVGAITIISMIIVCFRIRRKLRWGTKAKNDVNEEMFLKNHEFLAPKRYSYSQVKKITNSFKVKLGQGGFGSVYRGALSNGTLVAVKVLSELKGKREDFINEVVSVGMTSHVNIVSLLGFCLEGHQRALIYEFMPNGSLEKFIYGWGSSSNSQLAWGKLQEIAIGIARGLEYLHSGCNTRILHFDIKPHNILLDQDLCPKISDFGLAKLFSDKRSIISVSCMRGTPGYIAPELFNKSFGQVSYKADVYSYGMMILEMVGGRKNIEVEVDHTSEIYFPHWIYKKVELNEEKLGLHGIVSDEENEMARKMIIVGLWCIQTNPLSRPTITKVLEMLEGDLASMEIPPKPYLSSPSRSVGSSSTN